MNQVPYDLQAEKNILGNILSDPARLADVNLDDGDFYHVRHQKIFLAIKKLFDSSREVSLVTVCDYLAHDKDISPADISELVDDTIPIIAGSVAVVKKLSLARKALRLAQQLQADIQSPGRESLDINKLLIEFQAEILSLSAAGDSDRQEKTMKEIVVDGLARLEKILADPQHVTGIPSGFTELDKLTGGFHKSDLVILGARPGMGKTSFALDIIRHAAKKGYPVGMFSLEMAHEQIGDRTLSATSGVNLAKFRNGYLSRDDLNKATMAANGLYSLPVVIDDNSGLNIDELTMKALRMFQKHRIEMIVTDYLQLIESQGRSRHEEVGMICWKLKTLAKRLNIPVVALSQLNRGVEARENKRPVLSDLKESGDIEAHADMIIFLYRDDYYHKESKCPGETEVTLAKHRNGPTGFIRLKWEAETTTFKNLEKVRNWPPTQQEMRDI